MRKSDAPVQLQRGRKRGERRENPQITSHRKDAKGAKSRLILAANSDGQTMVLIQSDSLETDGMLVRNMLKGENFFDVEDHPEILFVSHSFDWTGTDKAMLRGDLTLRGVTRPVTFHVTLTPANDAKGEKITVEATTRIDRAKFGMDKLEKIADNEVQLCISAEAKKYESVSAYQPGAARPNS